MTHVRQILLTALLVLTVVSVGLLVGCEGRQRFGFGGAYYSSSNRMYPRSTSYGGYLYSPGNISRIHSRSYPSTPLVIHRGYRTSGYYSPYIRPYTRPYTRPHTSRRPSRRPHHYPRSSHSTGHSTGHSRHR